VYQAACSCPRRREWLDEVLRGGRLRVAILIPAYNEERAIRRVVESALAVMPDVFVVDDGSTDATLDQLAGLPIQLIRHASAQGKGCSLRDGFREILDRGFDAVVTMDGDGQHDCLTSRTCSLRPNAIRPRSSRASGEGNRHPEAPMRWPLGPL
jgi:hypothetical protein